ncbi:MAG: dihydrofolate reductase family protein [Armatimonadota bacterium]
MVDVVLYIACSLDGFIATPEHGLEWLPPLEQAGEDYGYRAFYDAVDAVLMGSGTYEQVLRLGPWPYADKPCWVFSRRRLAVEQPGVVFTAQPPKAVVEELTERGLQRAWLVGGGKLLAAFREEQLVTEYIISIIPIILGAGIPLFPPPGPRETLRLVESRAYASGLVQLRYRPDR